MQAVPLLFPCPLCFSFPSFLFASLRFPSLLEAHVWRMHTRRPCGENNKNSRRLCGRWSWSWGRNKTGVCVKRGVCGMVAWALFACFVWRKVPDRGGKGVLGAVIVCQTVLASALETLLYVRYPIFFLALPGIYPLRSFSVCVVLFSRSFLFPGSFFFLEVVTAADLS